MRFLGTNQRDEILEPIFTHSGGPVAEGAHDHQDLLSTVPRMEQIDTMCTELEVYRVTAHRRENRHWDTQERNLVLGLAPGHSCISWQHARFALGNYASATPNCTPLS